MALPLPPLAAETIFHIGSFPVTNSYFNTTLALVLFVVFVGFLRLGMNKYYSKNIAPKGLVNFFETIIELILSFINQVTGDKNKSYRLLPVVGSFFLFILIANWLGLLPGTGSLYIWGMHHGSLHQLPLLRPSNTDLNMTIAMSVLAVSMSHILGIAAIGFFKYTNRFIKLKDLWEGIKSFNPVKLFTAIVEFFVGIIEVFSEIAKMVSLSLRLYGNIFAGEVLLTVLAGLVAYVVPLPFMALELLVGLIQAVVFSMLTLVYMNMATTDSHGHGEAGAGGSHVEVEENQVPAV